ncbi:uncharacterized protein SAMN05421767_11531 [Granulicatella balaenopterae]|uniref:HD/PDEase domain-containing protein n=1 Tax=Granulicatella balaenopterae TaxID=137733 RepID=A0A1H9KU97_9LACT|nr:HD domain-containing protein [Granulicatella balaenopterae]SER02373.1 uncharacterized protein SAMN05421767_11531 [Granulicatella balaenopterae]
MKKHWTQDTHFVEIVGDLVNTDAVKKLDEITHHHVTTRFEHSASVAYVSYKLAKRFKKMDEREVSRAALLHDLFYYDWRETKFIEGSHAYVHPRIAAENAEKLMPLTDKQKDIIVKHMWPMTIALPKYKESFMVSCVDKYCALKEVIVLGTPRKYNQLKVLAASALFFLVK